MRELISSAEAEQCLQLSNCGYLLLDQIHVRESHQLDQKKINIIKQHLEQGGECLPIEVRPSDKARYCIAGDGRHRYRAHLELGIPCILCRIRVQ